jgi:hypothetical protein
MLGSSPCYGMRHVNDVAIALRRVRVQAARMRYADGDGIAQGAIVGLLIFLKPSKKGLMMIETNHHETTRLFSEEIAYGLPVI